MMHRNTLPISTFALVVFIGCSSNQTVEQNNNKNPAMDGGGGASSVTLLVSYQSQSVKVDLGSIKTFSYKDVVLVKLSDVWSGSEITADRTTLEFEFVATDGFKPSEKGCADVSGSMLDKGYVDPTSRNLTWDESLGFRGCYSVKGTAQMNAHAPTGDSDAG